MSESKASDIALETFLGLREHLTVVHHVPGRIRLRVSPTLFKQAKGVDPKTVDRVLEVIPGIREFLAELSREEAWGDSGYLTEQGLVPMSAAKRKKYRGIMKDLTPMRPDFR